MDGIPNKGTYFRHPMVLEEIVICYESVGKVLHTVECYYFQKD